MGRKRNIEQELVTWDSSQEWGTVWGYLPDPDVILSNTGLTVEVFDSLLSDAHVFACYQSRKAGVLTADFRIEYPDGAEKTAEYFDKMMQKLPVKDIVAQFLDAPFYGFSVNEIIWEVADGKVFPKQIAQKPNDWFVWDYEGQLRFLSRRDMIRGEMLPQDKFIVPRHFATYKNPYGLRTLSRCFWPVAFKKGGLKYWMQFMEKFGIPWLVGKVPRGTSKDQRTALLTDLSTMVQSAVAVINDDETIEAMDMGRGTSSRSNNIYAEMANNANGEISKAILTQTLTTEIGDKGAYAASQSHLKVRSELCEMDKELVAGAFNRLFEICCKLNFAGAVTPQFIFVREEDPKEEYARRDTQLSGQGVRFSEEYYARQYNLRVDEFTVVDPTPPPAQAAPGNDKENESVQNKKRVEQRTKTRENPAKSTKPKDKK